MLPPLRNRRFQRVLTRFSGILDEVPGAAFAIAPYTKLSRTQTQSIEVRETGDNTEQIFGPESQAAIEAFVGANDGRIATAYNAGSETADALQATAANQPFIATAGVLEDGMRFDGSDDHFTFTLAATVTGTIIVGTTEGIYAAESTLAAGTYSLSAKGVSTDYRRTEMNVMTSAILFNRTLSAAEIAKVKAAMVEGGAVESFGAVTNFTRAWFECSSLEDFPLLDTSSGTDFSLAWFDCNSLTSFPLIDTSSGTNFGNAWLGCSSLTSFPLINTSSGTDFRAAWFDCSSLEDFPLLDTSSGTDFSLAWFDCNSLTSFPLIDTSSGTNFSRAWRNCTSLEDFPANFFDAWNPASISNGVFNLTWDICTSLTSTSVENILVSLDTSGKYGTDTGLSGGTVLTDNTIDIDYDGSGLTAATNTAITNLKAKDWQVEINGVLQ